MRLMTVRPGGKPNFGDELNTYLWPQFVAHPPTGDVLFHGIGSVLNARCRPAKHRIVFGSGAGYYGLPTLDESWHVYFVRGPQTARALGGVASITDPAILVRGLVDRLDTPRWKCAFMPRWDATDDWPDLYIRCEDAGIHLIHPQDPVQNILSNIAATELLLSETLHGAVVANALRVPWISVYGNPGHEFKWYDWCSSLDMVWNALNLETYSLSWIRDNAVPQLLSRSLMLRKHDEILEQLRNLNADIKEGIYA